MLNVASVNISYLREELIRLINEDTQHDIFATGDESLHFPKHSKTLINNSPKFLRAYYSLLILAEECATRTHVEVREQLILNLESKVFVSDLVRKDLARCNVLACVIAWLTVDGSKWEDDCPEDLSYGLVLQYPEFVIPYATFILGTHRQAQLSSLDESTYYQCLKLAGAAAINPQPKDSANG